MSRSRRCVVSLLAAGLFVSCGLGPRGPGAAHGETGAAMNAAARAVLELVDAQRAAAGLPPLAVSAACTACAQAHSDDMAARRFFSHDSPTESFEARIRRCGFAGELVAEAIGRAATPEAAVESWMMSPPHRANILNPAFVFSGVGFAGGKYTLCLSEAPGLPGPSRR